MYGKDGKGKTSVILSVVLVIILILPAVNLTANEASQNPTPNPQLEPKENEISGFPAGWSGDIRLSYSVDDPLGYTANCSTYPSIAVNGLNIHVVWEEQMGYTATGIVKNSEIFYRRSTDGGATWGEPIQLTYDFFEDPTEFTAYGSSWFPQIAINGSNIHVAYETLMPGLGKFEIFYINSTNNGETWNQKQMLTTNDTCWSHLPHIAVNGSHIHIVWIDDKYPGGEICYMNSTDGGLTWNTEQKLTSYVVGTDGTPHIAVEGDNIHIFTSRYLSKYELLYLNSNDGGITWNPEQYLSPNDGIDTFGMGIAVNGSNVHLAYEDFMPSEVYYMNSTDGGASWSPIKKRLSDTPYSSYSPVIALNGSNLYIVWTDIRDGDPYSTELYYANSSDNGISWSENKRLTYAVNASIGPAIAFGDDMLHVVWWDNRTGREPLIIADNYEIYYKRYPDFPDLSPPDHFNETPPPESYKDAPGTNISVHVTDPSGVNESTIQLWVNGSLVSHSLTPITDGYNVSYESPGFSPGVVECRIVADDNCSNQLDYYWNFTVLAIYEIPLQEGWNLISVPHVQVDTAIDVVLKDIDGKWNYIQWYDASDSFDHWKTNATFKPQQLNDLFYLNRSMAFWINITELDVNLTVRGHRSAYTEIPLYAGWNFVGYPTQTTETVGNALWGTGADRVEVCDPEEPYRIKEVPSSYVMKPGEGYWVHVPANSVWKIDW